jgi:hypothetical protein
MECERYSRRPEEGLSGLGYKRHSPIFWGCKKPKPAPTNWTKHCSSQKVIHTYWATSTVRKGYSGVALYTRKEPNDVKIGLGIEEYDQEGRTIIAEYDDFVFLTAISPMVALRMNVCLLSWRIVMPSCNIAMICVPVVSASSSVAT